MQDVLLIVGCRVREAQGQNDRCLARSKMPIENGSLIGYIDTTVIFVYSS